MCSCCSLTYTPVRGLVVNKTFKPSEMSYLFLMLLRITHTQGIRTQHPTTILEILKAFNRDLSLGGGEGGVTPAVIYTRVIQ